MLSRNASHHTDQHFTSHRPPGLRRSLLRMRAFHTFPAVQLLHKKGFPAEASVRDDEFDDEFAFEDF